MDLNPFIARLQRELAVAAAAAGPEAEELAARLTAPLESGARLALLEALTTAAGEISLELDDVDVDVRLRGLDPELVVTRAAASTAAPAAPAPTAPEPDDAGGTARFSLRLPERLKPRLEQAADRAGVSVNAWLVRTVSEALESRGPVPGDARPSRGGWVR